MSTTALAAVLAKFAGLNIAGKAVVGLAVAAGTVGAVGGIPAVANHLAGSPKDAQVAVTAPAVESTADASATQEPTEGATDAAVEAKDHGPTDLPTAATFGQRVAADARDGGVDGQQIAAEARAKAEAEVHRAAAGVSQLPPVAKVGHVLTGPTADATDVAKAAGSVVGRP
jgi:hypothetical protein